MALKRANWDQRLTRAFLTSDGKKLRSLREAAAFVAGQTEKRQNWLSVAQALMIASFQPEAVAAATIAIEKALREDGKLKKHNKLKKHKKRSPPQRCDGT